MGTDVRKDISPFAASLIWRIMPTIFGRILPDMGANSNLALPVGGRM